ncbi:MAG: 5'-3' exonuclease [Acidobacteriota bacterium]
MGRGTLPAMEVHLVDGTYELFRHFFAVPRRQDREGNEVGAAVAVAGSVLSMIRDGATHVGVATDHVIESFRNQLWPGYKTGEGIEPELKAQFPVLEEVLAAVGLVVWAMVEYEADDAMATAARVAAADDRVDRVLICSPDKDLCQCVVGDRVVTFDRRKGELRDAAAVRERFGVEPESIPDWLALVGDSADGFPGVPGWGAKTASAMLARYRHVEEIPEDPEDWEPSVRGPTRLAEALREHRDELEIFKDLATLRTEAIGLDDVDHLRWSGPAPQLSEVCERLDAEALARQARSLGTGR